MALKRVSKTEKETLTGVYDGIEVIYNYEYQTGEKPEQIDARAEVPELGIVRFSWLNNESSKNQFSVNTYNIDISQIPTKLIMAVIKEIQGILA